MADAARKLDETRVRAALSRLLVPALTDTNAQKGPAMCRSLMSSTTITR